MSKSGKTASGAAQGEQSTGSVYDFLYNDSRRVGSYLAQLDENGMLTEIRQGEQVSKGSKRGFNLTGSVLGTGGGLEVTPKEGGAESSERVYDPFWANALYLMDTLDERGMIHRDLGTAPIGGIVLISGEMSVIDLGLLKEMWALPGIRKLMLKGVGLQDLSTKQGAPKSTQGGPNRHDRRAADKQTGQRMPASDDTDNAVLMLELMPVLPHSMNVLVFDGQRDTWANLKEEHLIGNGSDLVLKHGVLVPGRWQILGVLDAQPDEGGQGDVAANSRVDFTDPGRQKFSSLAGQMAVIMSPIVRIMLGRAGSHYGVTPLLIFREVGHAGI
jgi:hypothetical protein